MFLKITVALTLLTQPLMAKSSDSAHTKFNTEKLAFDQEYKQKSHLQDNFNESLMAGLIEHIAVAFPETGTKPLNILDLCCGHGKPTYLLLEGLKKRKIKVKQIKGLDISASQIKTAQDNYGHHPKLSFAVNDLETYTPSEKYDVIVSFFGLHWIENLTKVAENIANSLTPKGFVFFIVPLEKMDLFKAREAFITSKKWRPHFTALTLTPFHEKADSYSIAFNKFFTLDATTTKAGTRLFNFTSDKLISFLSSWTPETRHIKTKMDPHLYLNDFVQNLKDMPNLKKDNTGNFIFTEHFYVYRGHLKGQET